MRDVFEDLIWVGTVSLQDGLYGPWNLKGDLGRTHGLDAFAMAWDMGAILPVS